MIKLINDDHHMKQSASRPRSHKIWRERLNPIPENYFTPIYERLSFKDGLRSFHPPSAALFFLNNV